MIGRLSWLLFGRWLQKTRTTGFRSDVRAYAQRSTFSGFNVLRGNTVVADCSVGRFTYFGGGFIANCDIGAFVSIGSDVRIGGLGTHPTSWISTHPAFYSTLLQAGESFVSQDYFQEHRRTSIGNDVWIGTGCIVLDGVLIGDGAVVAAGSVVTNDVEAYQIVGGIPAKVLRTRFSPAEIAQLRESQWWNWSIDRLRRSAPFFRQDSVGYFLAKITS